MNVGNLRISIAYPNNPPDLGEALQAYLLRKYGGINIDKSMMGVIQKDVARFVAARWSAVVTVEPA